MTPTDTYLKRRHTLFLTGRYHGGDCDLHGSPRVVYQRRKNRNGVLAIYLEEDLQILDAIRDMKR
tara:strand:+ start:122 stop:316 length:195 start_codon:yes stop_codon:yes gene_type:complete